MKTLVQISEFACLLAGRAIARECLLNRVKKVLVTKRLWKELDRPRFHRPHRHGNVTVAGNENDWNNDIGPKQLSLQVEAAQPWQSHVKHEACRHIRALAT